MDWQQIAALAVVVTTALLFAQARLRRRKFSFERDTHCGCSNPSTASTILFHARKGERPTVVVRTK